MTTIPKGKSNRYNITKMTTHDLEEPTDEEILVKAYHNAWLLFSGKKTFTEISLSSKVTESYMPFDPYDTMDRESFEVIKENMLAHYVDTEEYEKCAYLRDYTYPEYVVMMEPLDFDKFEGELE